MGLGPCTWLVLAALIAICGCSSFLHLTDVHFDPQYRAGSWSTCQHPHELYCCCRPQSVKRNNGSQPAGRYGAYDCDTPMDLLLSSLILSNGSCAGNLPLQTSELCTTKTPSPEIDFVLWTGDNPPHDCYTQTKAQNLANIYETSKLVRASFPNTVVLPSLGNHDYWKCSQFALPPKSDWLLDEVYDYWKELGFLPAPALKTLKESGYYTVELRPGLRVISLNTNYYDAYNLNAWDHPLDYDDAGQFAWADKVLAAARANNEKIYIIGHIPPGARSANPFPMTTHKFSKWYMETIEKYSDIIRLNLFGHSHMNEMRMFTKDDEGVEATGVMYMSPAATPWEKQNPSIRFFDYNSSSFEILDYHQYYADMVTQTDGPLEWQHLYTATKAPYFLKDLSAQSWLELLKDVGKNETLFDYYYQNWKSRCPKGNCKLGEKCAKQIMCAQTHIEWSKVEECVLGL